MKWRKNAPSTLESLKILRREAMEILDGWKICSEDDRFALEIIILELLSNAAKHGNQWQAEKKVKVNMRYLPGAHELFLLVCDEGHKQIKVLEVDSLAENGRGLFMVEALCSQLKVGSGRVWIRKELQHEKKNTSC